MKLNFKDISIRFKIIILTAFISTVSLIVSALFFFIFDKSEFKNKTLRDLTILVEIVGKNNTAAITFNDKRAAQESLSTIVAEKQIIHAIIYTKNFKILAQYFKNTSDIINELNYKDIPKSGYIYMLNSLYIIKPVVLDNETIGYVFVHSSLDEYNERFSRFLSFISLVILYTILVIIVLSFILQIVISNPIIKLFKQMKEVTAKRDFSIRMKKNSNDELGQLYDGFNHMLIEIESQNKALEEAKNRAEKADNLKSVFLSNMSHEIRTPLNAIIGFSDLLINRNVQDKDKADYLYYINSSSKILLQLINDIIDIAKIEAEQLKIYKSNINVNPILNELSVTFNKEIKMKGKTELSVSLLIPENDVIIQSDSLRLRQILSNLISNAIKFTDSGTIEVGYNIKDNNTLVFYVKDSGVGIEQNNLKLIFDRFKQVKESDSNLLGGTGLGLSICKNLVHLLGGKIWAESEVNKGSIFYFTHPYNEL